MRKVFCCLVLVGLSGCFKVQTWSGSVYECPTELLTNIQAQLKCCAENQGAKHE